MVKITARITPAWLAAVERAYTNRQAGRVVVRTGNGTYTAPSSTGSTSYTVTVLDVASLQATCTCPHGQHPTAGHCWHTAQALNAEVAHVATKRQELAAIEAKFDRMFGRQ